MQSLLRHIVDEQMVDSLEADRPKGQDFGNVVGSLVDIAITQYNERARGRAGHQAERCLENRHARSLAPHQCARDVKAVFGQQLIEAISRNAAWDLGEASADPVGISVA